MPKLLITGFSGFVASYFTEYLYNNQPDIEVYGIGLGKPIFEYIKYRDKMKVEFYEANLVDSKELSRLVGSIKPDFVLHLAAYSSVAYSWEHPGDSFINNCNIFLNLVEAVRKYVPCCRIVSVGSSEEYGNVSKDDLPIKEYQSLNPLSPYAVARVSQEHLSKIYADTYGLRIIMTRSFNHIGPRQDNRFVVPSLIERVLRIRNLGKSEGEIETGDLSVIRDFVDVRDVVDAYYKLLMNGRVGEVYNICSGNGVTLSEILDIIAEEVGVNITAVNNQKYIRPNESREIIGSPQKIESELGWKRYWGLRDTIRDMIEYRRD